MTEITVNTKNSYKVIIGENLLKDFGNYFSENFRESTAVIVSDDNVYGLYGNTVIASLKEKNINVVSFVFPHGEKNKNTETYINLVEFLCDSNINRNDVIVALGGGVAGDISGFAAASYKRGIRFIQLPTTLLASVDSSVGGKNAVNLKNGKNCLGTFYQPSLVICDTLTLKTLPEKEYRQGCAEIIKYSLISDKELFNMLLIKPVMDNYEEIIARCIKIKRDFVVKDEFDKSERMLLNFGHTFAHSAEKLSGYTLPHGDAVAMGMASITKQCEKLNICKKGSFELLKTLLSKYGLPTSLTYPKSKILSALLNDKKINGENINIVIPKEIGNCKIINIPLSEIENYLPDEV